MLSAGRMGFVIGRRVRHVYLISLTLINLPNLPILP